jgi:hypothetical protein
LLQNVNRVMAWLLLWAVVVLSLISENSRPTTFVPHKAEHAAIFLAAGFCFGMAYLGRKWLLSIGAIIFCAAIELLQPYVSGTTCASERFYCRRDCSRHRNFCGLHPAKDMVCFSMSVTFD